MNIELYRTDGQVETLRDIHGYQADVTKGLFIFRQNRGLQLRNMELTLLVSIQTSAPTKPNTRLFGSETVLIPDGGKRLTVRDAEGLAYRWDTPGALLQLTTRSREVFFNLHRLESFWMQPLR